MRVSSVKTYFLRSVGVGDRENKAAGRKQSIFTKSDFKTATNWHICV